MSSNQNLYTQSTVSVRSKAGLTLDNIRQPLLKLFRAEELTHFHLELVNVYKESSRVRSWAIEEFLKQNDELSSATIKRLGLPNFERSESLKLLLLFQDMLCLASFPLIFVCLHWT